MYRFEDDSIVSLLNAPEYGMGYQRIRATLHNGNNQTGYVFNAELFVPDENPMIIESARTYARALGVSAPANKIIREFQVLSHYSTMAEKAHFNEDRDSLKESTGAADASVTLTEENEIFKRFTAYANDRRITTNHCLLPGTYATTRADAQKVYTGRQAVARYALPNPQPAVYVFTITPLKETKIRRGMAQPAHNQPGGGAEVVFIDGTTERNCHRSRSDSGRLKMLVKLQQKWIDYLVSKPESGMGYQRVDIRLQNDCLVEDVKVFNAEDLELPDEFARLQIKELRLHQQP